MESPNKELIGCFSSETLAIDSIILLLRKKLKEKHFYARKELSDILEMIESGVVSTIKDINAMFVSPPFRLTELNIDQHVDVELCYLDM